LGARGRLGSPEAIQFASNARAIARSPTGDWIAVARPGQVCVFPVLGQGFPIHCLRGDAVDVAWR